MKWVIAFVLSLMLAACSSDIPVTSFEECVLQGNPVMESYPRQCRVNDQVFVEEIDIVKEEPKIDFHVCTEEQKQAQACTFEYDPVCAVLDNNIRCVTEPCQSTDVLTHSNGCSACSAQANGYYKGMCETQLFVVCKETVTGFDPVQFAQDQGGICVDVCPGNYDSYTTQTGIELCIEHYGLDEIKGWDACDRSSDDCNCVNAYETTKGQEIVNSKYRCVPEQYASRLLFRAGIDHLDESGEQSVVIA